MSYSIRSLDRLEDVRSLEPLLGEYIRYITTEAAREFGVTFDADQLLAKTRAGLAQVIPPHGHTFVAEDIHSRRLGMAFLRPSGPDAMEIKRLYVPPAGRGQGIGKALVLAATEAARGAGATSIRIDTSRNLTAAISLYRGLGFELRPPYEESDHYEDPVLGPYIIFMEKQLSVG